MDETTAADASIIWEVSDFVAVLNQALEYSFSSVAVSGELANFRISKGKWVYFDLKDELASVRCFGTVYMLPGPLEDGMLVTVRAVPRLHPQFGFSLTISSIRPTGEGSIRQAADLLQAKLTAEGLFADERKRFLPYPPRRIGLIASGESAAYVDFIKVLQARWTGLDIVHVDVQVQGEVAPAQIVAAIEQLNGLAAPPEVLVITRGGGSAEDLQAFSSEQVTRAVAASRVPTLVAIGHEIDVSLAELAADRRASTPSNAAELLVPDRTAVLAGLVETRKTLGHALTMTLKTARTQLQQTEQQLGQQLQQQLQTAKTDLHNKAQLLAVLSPQAVLRRGYAIVYHEGKLVRSIKDLGANDAIAVRLSDGAVKAHVDTVQ